MSGGLNQNYNLSVFPTYTDTEINMDMYIVIILIFACFVTENR